MTLQNVTVIIPAHNRPERLRRLLDYYSRTDIKVLVPDSSDHPFADAEKYPDITYLHRPKLHFLLKLKEVLPMISTPYVLYCADDDFAVPSGIAQMTAFLDEHSGESQYENFFSDLCGRHPGRVGTYIGFEPALSQEIYAGADAFIMPSKSEPCGLAQMVACRYGTPPIIRETGGLRDSIHDCTLGEGNGFTFAGYSAHELYDACCRAQDRYYSKEDWHNLVKYDMECDFSWDVSAKSYEGLYNETANLW